MLRKKLPIGIDGFEKLRTNDFYYVDKTMFIKELLQNWGEVNLFTRPRRFGKTLNMSMLKCFFEIGSDPALKERIGIVIELKYAADSNLEAACWEALNQIEEKNMQKN